MKAKLKTKTGSELIATLFAVVTASPDAAAYVAEEGIPDILEYCLKLRPSDKDAAALVEVALKVVKEAAASGKASSSNLEATMKLIDMYKAKKGVVDRGSAAIAAMMGPKQLKTCLATLSSAAEGSEERKAALGMLSSMSYIGSYAEAIVKVGSLPLLCNALESGFTRIGMFQTQSSRFC